MKLMDWIDRKPSFVGFGRRAGGGEDTTGSLPPPPEPILPPDFESRAAVEVADLDPSITFVRTAGYAVAGDGGGGLYARTLTEPAHELKIQSADGAFWELIPEGGQVTEKQAGGVGDGVADDTAAIQNVINYVLYRDPSLPDAQPVEVKIIGPSCRITDTIHIGYGDGPKGIVVRGVTQRRRDEIVNAGTALVATFTDRPIVNFQGARMSELSDIWIEGALSHASVFFGGFDVTQEATWDALGGDGRYNPYAAITIDAFSGSRPAQSYPDATYPAFLQPIAQYGKTESSDITISNVGIRDVNTAIAVQPSDTDANGDFVKVVDCTFEQCRYGVSVGNSQSRNIEVSNLIGLNVFVAFVNGKHGRQIGRFGGPIANCSFGGFLGRVFEFTSSSVLGATLFTNFYVEGLDRIGTFTSNTSAESALTFESCLFAFRHTDQAGVPPNVLDGANETQLVFRSCQFTRAPSVHAFAVPRVAMENSRISVDSRSSGTIDRYLAYAHNATSGGLVLDPLNLTPQSLLYTQFNLDTGTSLGGVITSEVFFKDTIAPRGIPLAVWEFSRFSEIYGPPARKRLIYYERDRAVHFSNVSLIDRTLTLEFNSLADHEAMRLGVLPGDVIRDRGTGMVFFIRSRTGTTVIAEAQNNYVDNGAGGFDTVVPFSTTAGGLQFLNSRYYTPSYTTFGDFSTGSNTATNAARVDGFAGYLPTDIQVGDYLFADQDPDFIFANGEAEVTGIDATVQTITFAGNARNSATKKSLTQWIRQPPPNS